MDRQEVLVVFIVSISFFLIALLLPSMLLEPSEQVARGSSDNLTGNETSLQYHGYFQVYDRFISMEFYENLASDPKLSGRDWSRNLVHLENAGQQSNVVVVPHSVTNSRGYLYDPEYLESCRENDLKMILLVHGISKYVYFLDPRPCSVPEATELLMEEFRVYEKLFRRYREDIMAVYVYDEPWVRPNNVTQEMLDSMVDAARDVFWDKPVLVMFHRQGNNYSYRSKNGSLIRYDQWVGDFPQKLDLIGVDPYFYAYHDEEPDDFRHTGDKSIVESDVSWASSFGKPVVVVGQAYDPGADVFFDSDNRDPRLYLDEGFEDGGIAEEWEFGGGTGVTGARKYRGNRSLLLEGGDGISTAVFSYPTVHSIRVKFRFITSSSSPAVWITLGDTNSSPVRLGIQGRDLLVHTGRDAEIVNCSIDVAPGRWHTLTLDANVDANRWVFRFDGDIQTRLPNAVLPGTFNRVTLTALEGSGSLWVDDLEVERDWSLLLPNQEETLLYYQVARKYPVSTLLWWSYPHSFSSSLVENGDQLQVEDIWNTQREIWEMMGKDD